MNFENWLWGLDEILRNKKSKKERGRLASKQHNTDAEMLIFQMKLEKWLDFEIHGHIFDAAEPKLSSIRACFSV